jgi:tRNA/rRNA methyltransferase
MSFDQLVLVQPRDLNVVRRERTKQAASGALDVLKGCVIFDSLEEALDGVDVKCGTGMPVDMSLTRNVQEFAEPRRHFEKILKGDGITYTNNESLESVAFVFGNERMGMTPEDMVLCDVMLGIPTNPLFGSLNLASAVQLIAYDWRQALGGFDNIYER